MEALVYIVEQIAVAIMSAGAIEAGFLILGNAAAIASGALLLGGLAYSSSQARKAKRMARDAYNAAQVDRLVTVESPTAPRELVMGRVRKSGTVFFKGSTDTNNTKFVMCVALASHEIDAVETIYLNDSPVTLDGDGYVTSEPYTLSKLQSGSVAFSGTSVVLDHAPPSAAHVTVVQTVGGSVEQFDAGTATIPFSLSGDTITVDAQYSGYSKTVQYQWTDSASKARIRSYLGSPSQTADATLISLFPALWTSAHRARGVAYLICEFSYDEQAYPSGLPSVSAVIRGAKLYDPRTGLTAWSENPALMARHILTHPQFGKRTSLTAAEDARIIAAANACDTATVYTVAGVAQATRALYKAALVLPYGGHARDALDDITQAMAGMWAYAAGEFYVKAGVYTASVKSLSDADLAVVVRGPGGEQQSPIEITTHRARDQMFNVVVPTIWDQGGHYKSTAITPLKGSALITRDGAELVREVAMPAVGYAPQALHVAGVMMRDARDPLMVVLPFKLGVYAVELFDTVDLTIARYGWASKLFVVMGREWGSDGALRLTLKETSATIFSLDADFAAQGGAANTALPVPWALPQPGSLAAVSGGVESVLQADGTYLSRLRVSWAAIEDLAVTQGGQVEVQYRASTSEGAWQTAMVSGAETSVAVADVTAGVHYQIRARTRNSVAVGAWTAQITHLVLGIGSPVVEYREHAEGWTGTRSGCGLNISGIEATDTSTWATLPSTWSAWTRWNVAPASSISYTGPVRDLGTSLTGFVQTVLDADGAVTAEVRGSVASSAAVASATWQSTALAITARWFQVRITLAATAAAPIAAARLFSYTFNAPMQTEQWTDLSVAALPAAQRVSAGDVRLPMRRTYAQINYLQVTIRDTRPGVWSWSVVDKSAALGPRVQFRLGPDLTDPQNIDAYIEGV